jgi:hypothetical protein
MGASRNGVILGNSSSSLLFLGFTDGLLVPLERGLLVSPHAWPSPFSTSVINPPSGSSSTARAENGFVEGKAWCGSITWEREKNQKEGRSITQRSRQ